MNTHRYCVYNQASECFLSLDASRYGYSRALLASLFHKTPRGPGDSLWITSLCHWGMRRVSWSGDLIFLDDARRVLELVYSSPLREAASMDCGAASALLLAEDTIRSSHTQRGDQLLVCSVAEMKSKLTHLFDEAHADRSLPAPAIEHLMGHSAEPQHARATDRKDMDRTNAPLFVAWHWSTAGVMVDPIRNISETGLYLITNERWPIGATVNLNVEPLLSAGTHHSGQVSTKARVVRWGVDGVDLEFLTAEPRLRVPELFVTSVN